MGNPQLGRLVAVYQTDPAYLQRGFFITLLSFLFFLATSGLLYYRGGLVYFILSTAFLIIYLLSLFSLFRFRRTELRVYELGFSFRGRNVPWPEVSGINPSGEIRLSDGKTLVIPKSLLNFQALLDKIRRSSVGE